MANTEKLSCRGHILKAIALITASKRTVQSDALTARFFDLKVATQPDTRSLTREVDLLMVFGGDGTMLRVAREIAGVPTPILGINVGGLGFLTDVQAHQLPLVLRHIQAGKTHLEYRPLIEAKANHTNPPIAERALNDFVISRGASPRLIELEVNVDHEVLTRYRGDGLIIASPTGSTAYSLAAGGAVVSPNADVFTLTPICPHTLSSRSVVVSLRSLVQVKVLSPRADSVLTSDGQVTHALACGDVVTFQRSRQAVHLLHLAGSSFFDTLRRKLNWSGSHVGEIIRPAAHLAIHDSA